MAHFARLDTNNIVTEVFVIDNLNCSDSNGNENENIGINYCKSFYEPVYGSDTIWKQTSYNSKIRKNFAGIGYYYDENLDAFIPPKPYNSWILNNETCRWEAPVPKPDLTEEEKEAGIYYDWNEENVNWESKSFN
jgi:hypothetical protein